MPFKSRARRSTRRRRSFRRRRGMGSTRAIAVRALRATDQERKFMDFTFDDSPINGTLTPPFSIFSLNLISEGTDNNNRIGRKIRARSLHLQLLVNRAIGDGTATTYFRVLIVLDRQPNGGLPTWGNMWDLPGSGNAGVEMMSPNNLNNSKRFKTLYDSRGSLYVDFMEGRMVRKFLRLAHTTQYNGVGATVGNVASNNLLLCITSSITTGGAVPTLEGTIRLRFVG